MGAFVATRSGDVTIAQAVYRDWMAVIICRACERQQRWGAPELVRRFPNALGATFHQVAERLSCEHCPDGGHGELQFVQGHTLGALEDGDEARIARLSRLHDAARKGPSSPPRDPGDDEPA